MPDVPDRVWLPPSNARHYWLHDSRFVEYRRVKPCVWRNKGRDGDNVLYTRDCGGIDMTIEWPGMWAMSHWHYCNYCGGRIEVKEASDGSGD